MKALILNSGLGRRMGVLTSEHPKCMTEISSKDTILSRQLRLIASSGIKEVVITTGYFDDVLVNYCHSLDLPLEFTFVNNPIYDKTNYITQNQTELAEIYTAADILANPTREENYPTVNMESIACGTPVLTFRTGGSPEILDENTGSIVDCNDIDAMEREIIRICEDKPYTVEACIERAKVFI